MSNEIFAATQDVFSQEIGATVFKGTTVRAGHPILKGHKDLFEKVDDVDEATYEHGTHVKRTPPASDKE